MFPTISIVRIGLIVVSSLLWLSTSVAQALLITHSEVLVSNILILPHRGVSTVSPWSPIATASAFDDLSGVSQAFDDDPDGDGVATAVAATSFVSAASIVSGPNLTIEVSNDLHLTSGYSALQAAASGHLFRQMLLTEATEVTFTLDYSAQLSGQADVLGLFMADYGINLTISDGITDFTLATFNVLTAPGVINDAGTLTDTFSLLPGVVYTLDLTVDPNTVGQHVPEPASILLLGSGLCGWLFRRCYSRQRV